MKSTIVVGLGFGDEGKGSIVDYLTDPNVTKDAATTVVRFNGGAQAAHNVVKSDGRHHTFAQFGSGTLNGAKTFLSRYMMVDPLRLAAEAEHLKELGLANPFDLLTIDGSCLLTTPFHALANQRKELARGDAAHGTTGVGIGETVAYSLQFPEEAPRVADCRDSVKLGLKLQKLRDFYGIEQDIEALLDAYDAFIETVQVPFFYGKYYLKGLLANENVVFEGAQGVLLDEYWGFAPHNTWSKTTFDNADTLIKEAGGDPGYHLGVMRTYMTRHGAGPFPTQDDSLNFPEPHNDASGWAGQFRLGHRDIELHHYAAVACGNNIDSIAVTHMDVDQGQIKTVGVDLDGRHWYSLLDAPVSIESYGPTSLDKRDIM